MKRKTQIVPTPEPEPVDTAAEIRVRQKQHQVELRQGSLVVPESEPTEAQLEGDTTRRRKQAHQKQLRGGTE